jgi:putative ABC transport system permease protein
LSLALSTLIYEWRRYLAAVIVLAVAAVLVLSMTGMFMGMSKSFTVHLGGKHTVPDWPACDGQIHEAGQNMKVPPPLFRDWLAAVILSLSFGFSH